MATNKWLSDMQTLKATTDTLRNTLRDKNVAAYDTDTLPTLVNKVPSLASIEIPEDEKWQPDPLWKFPDPNGTETTKTIREIYDEDALASTYTYRGIYQIRALDDTIDLKAIMYNRVRADTFILSDGTTYENITATRLVHTWDKTKDITDSKGNKQRYIRIYSNSVSTYATTINGALVWFIDNLHTTSFSTSSSYHSYPQIYLECAEFGQNVATMVFPMFDAASSCLVQKIIYDKPLSIYITQSNTNVLSYLPNLKEFDCIFSRILTTDSVYFLCNTKVNKLTFDPDSYTQSNLELRNSTSNSNNVEILENLESLTSLRTLTITGMNKLKNLTIPTSVTNLTTNYCPNISDLIIPENIAKFDVSNNNGLLNLIINSINLTSVIISNLRSLRTLIVPINWNFALNLSSSTLLEHDSIVNLLNNLKDLTGETAKTLTLGSTNLSKLTDEEKAIATNKNWTLT